ncbi:hypothetical protein M427DRAFT_72138, partial [Gonapodya prolifera JEL478]
MSGGFHLYSKGFCPFTQMARIALTACGVPYTFTRFQPQEPFPDWWTTASPDGSFPVLQLPDGSYTNSSAKMIAIGSEAGSSRSTLYPTAQVEEIKTWEAKLRSGLVQPAMKVLMAANPDIQAEFRPKLKEAVSTVTAQLKSRPAGTYFLGTPAPTSLDVIIYPILQRFPLITYFRGVSFTNDTIEAYVRVLESDAAFTSTSYDMAQMKAFFVKSLPKMKPMSAGRLQHMAIRRQFEKAGKLHGELETLAEGQVERAKDIAKELTRRITTLVRFIQEHASFEEEVVYPVFEEMAPGSTSRAHSEHAHDAPLLERFDREYKAALAAVELAPGEGAVQAAKKEYGKFSQELEKWRVEMDEHMAGEEKGLFPMTAQLGEREIGVFTNVYYHCSPYRELLLPFVLEVLSPQERMQYMHNIMLAVAEKDPEEWKKVGGYLKAGLSAGDVVDLRERLPALATVV